MKLGNRQVTLPAIAFFLGCVLLVTFNLGPSKDDSQISTPSNFPRGYLHDLLYRQNLSHSALHSPLRLHLTALFRPRTVAIVGVAEGHDARSFAAAGYRVHAIEPGVKFVRQLSADSERNPWWTLIVHPFAAAAQSNGERSVKYLFETVASEVPTRRVDELVTERLAVLSVDVQGAEPGVLRGASGLLPDKVDSLWVEINACYPQTLHVLRLLDRDYVLFDFVPRGNASVGEGRMMVKHAFDVKRPARFDDYQKWLCAYNGTKFNWLQTDVMAVRRDIVGTVWQDLGKMAERYCGHQHIFCNIEAV